MKIKVKVGVVNKGMVIASVKLIRETFRGIGLSEAKKFHDTSIASNEAQTLFLNAEQFARLAIHDRDSSREYDDPYMYYLDPEILTGDTPQFDFSAF